MGKRQQVQLSIGGEYTAGDAATIPDGSSRLLQNFLPRPNRIAGRPPFVYDNLMAINGLANFDDTANKVIRAVAVDTTQNLYVKATSGETWSGATAGVAGVRVTGACNYAGKLYLATDDGSGTPAGLTSFDGTNLNTSPLGASIYATEVVPFDDRIFLINLHEVVTPKSPVPLSLAYDWSGLFAINNAITITIIDAGSGRKTMRLSPGSTAINACDYMPLVASFTVSNGSIAIATSSVDQSVTWLFGSRGVDAFRDVPITLELVLVYPIDRNSTFLGGELMSNGNGFRYRCTTAGTTAGVAPAYGTTIGGTTADGTATFTCDGSDILGSVEDFVLNVTDAPDWTDRYLSATCPPSTANYAVSPRLKLYNTKQSALTALVPIDVSFRDGLTDGDARKKNHGTQITLGSFRYPFFNKEVATSATFDLPVIAWTDLFATTIQANFVYNPREHIGKPTAGWEFGGRLFMTKRNAIWVFQGTGDPDIPIQRERIIDAIGCIGSRAHDNMMLANDYGASFFIGDSEVYALNMGGYRSTYATPEPLAGDGMREEIFARGANWVESQSTYNRPLLAIDKRQFLMWVYTQKGKLYSYDLRSKAWATHIVSSGLEVDAMLWNENTGNFYVSFGGHGLARMDYSSSTKLASGDAAGAIAACANDTVDNTATTYPVTFAVAIKPIELSNESWRFDATLEEFRILHAIMVSGQSVKASYSFDQGKTWPKSETVTITTLSGSGEFVPLRLGFLQSGPSVMIKLEVTGKGGEAACSLSPRAAAFLNIMAGEFVQSNPTATGSTL